MSGIIRRFANGLVPSGGGVPAVRQPPTIRFPRGVDPAPGLPGPEVPSRFPMGAAAAAGAAAIGAGVAGYQMGGGGGGGAPPQGLPPVDPAQPAPEPAEGDDGYGAWAAAMAEAETGKTRAERIADADARSAEWDRRKAAYDEATGAPTGGYQSPITADDIRAENDAKAGKARQSWDKWVGESTERQGRFDPAASDARIQQSFDDHAAFDAKIKANPKFEGRTPEEVNRAGVPLHYQRKMWLNQMAQRYRRELADGSITLSQLAAEYDAGVGGQQKAGATSAYGNEAHKAGAMGARNLTDMLDAQRKAQIGLNVDRNWDQINLARQLGVGRGQVIAMQDIQRSLASGDNASAAAKMAMYGMAPEAYRSLMAMHGGIEEARAKKEPTPPGLVESYAKEQAAANAQKPGTRWSAMQMVARQSMGGDKADEAAVDAKARLSYQPFASQMVSRGIDSLSPEERMELQAVSKGLRYREWLRYVGKADSPEMKQAYKSLTGNSTGFIDAVTPDWLTG